MHFVLLVNSEATQNKRYSWCIISVSKHSWFASLPWRPSMKKLKFSYVFWVLCFFPLKRIIFNILLFCFFSLVLSTITTIFLWLCFKARLLAENHTTSLTPQGPITFSQTCCDCHHWRAMILRENVRLVCSTLLSLMLF